MMRGLDHKNVLALIGVCVEDDDMRRSPLIVLPFMKHGDLRTFLRDGNNVSVIDDNICYSSINYDFHYINTGVVKLSRVWVVCG